MARRSASLRPALTAPQRALERASIGAAIADVGIFALLAVTALVSSSLTLLTEVMHAGGLLIVVFISVRTLRAVHRRRFTALSYGIGKVELLCNLMGCTALVVGGFWVANKVFQLLLEGGMAYRPSDLAIAAVAAAVSTLGNGLAFMAMVRAYRPDSSAIFLGQLNARRAKFYATLAAQAAITLSALARDPAVGALIDATGATIGACVMIGTGLSLGRRCVLGLLDCRAPDDLLARVDRALGGGSGEDRSGMSVRTRRSGRFAQIEVALEPGEHADLAALRRRAEALVAELSREFRDSADVSIVLRPGGAAS